MCIFFFTKVSTKQTRKVSHSILYKIKIQRRFHVWVTTDNRPKQKYFNSILPLNCSYSRSLYRRKVVGECADGLRSAARDQLALRWQPTSGECCILAILNIGEAIEAS